jgi:hypothetical protein
MPLIDLNKRPVIGHNSVLTFGMYKGETAQHILEIDPSYLIWVHSAIDWIEVDEDLLLECEEAVEQEKEKERNWRRR